MKMMSLRVAASASTAPISQAAPCGRVIPRWSVAAMHLAKGTMSTPALPASGKRVLVGPPKWASGVQYCFLRLSAFGTISVLASD